MAADPIDRESPFDVSELFFSTTNRKGIIESGNDVFVRVSKHPEAELIGSPHNIIRHPDMPRAAFRLLWDHLLRGDPIAAYVKNMAADGSYYWVMACVLPCGDGFLSVRLKPTSELLTTAVIPVYTEVRALERRMEQAGTPRREVAERSSERLLEMLAEAGFPDYASFMRMALPVEIRARAAAIAAGRAGEGAPSRGIAADLRLAGARSTTSSTAWRATPPPTPRSGPPPRSSTIWPATCGSTRPTASSPRASSPRAGPPSGRSPTR